MAQSKKPKQTSILSPSIHQILRPAAIANRLGIPVRTAQYLISHGVIPSVPIGLGAQRRHRGVTEEHLRLYLTTTDPHRGGPGEGHSHV